MSIPVDLAALPDEIERFGSRALLVTTSVSGPPHVASVTVTADAGCLLMRAGRKTRANVAERPAVALIWNSAADDEHCLIVDGVAREGPDDALVVEPASAVLHRLAG